MPNHLAFNKRYFVVDDWSLASRIKSRSNLGAMANALECKGL